MMITIVKRAGKVALLLCMAICMVCTKEQDQAPEPKDVVDLIPADGEISGWHRSQPMRIAENEAQLQGIVDGGYEVYVNNGFVKCAEQDFADEQDLITIKLQVFDQGDTAHAKDLYDALIPTSSLPWTDDPAGVESRIEQLIFSYEIDFWDDRFYAWLTISSATQADLDVAKVFARNVSAAIRDTTTQ